MAYLNANIPVEYAQIRREYLYDLKKHHGEVEDCIIFGVTCITGRALLFHAIMENGAIFTVDFAHPEPNILDTDHSEIPHEHKCAHILALNDGNYAAQPNNRLIWDIPSFTVKDQVPDWKVQTNYWNVEDTQQWRTEDTDNFFYEIEEKKK